MSDDVVVQSTETPPDTVPEDERNQPEPVIAPEDEPKHPEGVPNGAVAGAEPDQEEATQ